MSGITLNATGEVTINGDNVKVAVIGNPTLNINQGADIPTFTDIADIPTDGSVDQAYFAPTDPFVNANNDRVLIFYEGGSGTMQGNQRIRLGTPSSNTEVFLPAGWVVVAGNPGEVTTP